MVYNRKKTEILIMNLDKKLEFILEVIEAVDVSNITIDTSLEDCPDWDSIAALSVMSEVDDEFDVIISADQMENCKTFADIIKLF